MIRTVGSVTTTIVGSCLVPLTMLCFTLPLPYLVRNIPVLLLVGVERMARGRGERGGRGLGGVQHSSSFLVPLTMLCSTLSVPCPVRKG